MCVFFRRRFINHKNKSIQTIQLHTGGRGKDIGYITLRRGKEDGQTLL